MAVFERLAFVFGVCFLTAGAFAYNGLSQHDQAIAAPGVAVALAFFFFLFSIFKLKSGEKKEEEKPVDG